jgi:hypothetical protein
MLVVLVAQAGAGSWVGPLKLSPPVGRHAEGPDGREQISGDAHFSSREP